MEEWKNRIIHQGEKPADEFKLNSANFRTHPENQITAINGSLKKLGWIQQVIENVRTGNLIDGHARVKQAQENNNAIVPFIQVDLSEAEELIALTSLDPIAAMAETEQDKLDIILKQIEITERELIVGNKETEEELVEILNEDLSEFLTGLAEENNLSFNLDEENSKPETQSQSDGTNLEIMDIVIGEPTTKVEKGDIWVLDGKNIIICVDIFTEWDKYIHLLKPDNIFVPYPGVFVPLSIRAEEKRLIMVQPDKYIAGHMLDRYIEQGGKVEKN